LVVFPGRVLDAVDGLLVGAVAIPDFYDTVSMNPMMVRGYECKRNNCQYSKDGILPPYRFDRPQACPNAANCTASQPQAGDLVCVESPLAYNIARTDREIKNAICEP
jgi:hypothetical protein